MSFQDRGGDKDIFVLKTFRRKARKLYKREVEAYETIRRSLDGRNENSIVGFYGSFEHREAFHVILEYANSGTLQEYLNTIPPPMKTEDILSFWENFLTLTRALEGLHTTIYYEGGPNIIEKGWVSNRYEDISLINLGGIRILSLRMYSANLKKVDHLISACLNLPILDFVTSSLIHKSLPGLLIIETHASTVSLPIILMTLANSCQ